MEKLTRSQRASDAVSAFCGSWPFIITFSVVMPNRELSGDEEIECLEVKDVRTGETSWEPAADYRTNPAAGTYVVRGDRRKRSPQQMLSGASPST